MIGARFGVIDQVVARKRIDNDLRKDGIHQQISLGRTAVTHAVGPADADAIKRVRQIQDVGNRHLDRPDTVFDGGLIADVVQRHGNGGAVRQVAGAGQAQRLHRLLGIQDVILADGVNRKFRRVSAQRNAVRGAAGVTCRVSDGNRKRVVAFTQRAQHGRRNAHAPAAVRQHHAGEGLAAKRHGDHIARGGTARQAGNNVRLALLADIEDIVARHGMDGDDRRGGIHREFCRHGRTVARFVAHVNRQGVITLTQRLHVVHIKRDGPGAVAAHRGVIVFTVQGDRDDLTGFRIRFTGQGQRLIVLSRINDVVLRESIDREGWRGGIHPNRLASANGVTRHVFTAHVDRPGTVAQRLRVRRRHVNTPRAVCPDFSRVGFAVQRHGECGTLRQVFAGTGKRKARGLLAGVQHVIARRGGQRNGGIGGRDRHGDTARRGGFTAVDLHDGPGVLPVRLGR